MSASAAVAELVPLMATGQYLGRPDVRYARSASVIVERTNGLPAEPGDEGWTQPEFSRKRLPHAIARRSG